MSAKSKDFREKFDLLIAKVHNGLFNQTVSETIVVNIKPPPFSPPFSFFYKCRKEKEVAETFFLFFHFIEKSAQEGGKFA